MIHHRFDLRPKPSGLCSFVCDNAMYVGVTRIIIFFLVCSFSNYSRSLQLDEDLDNQAVTDEIFYMLEQYPVDIDTVLQAPGEAWTRVQDTVNFGYTDRTYWFKFVVTNPSHSQQSRLLQVSYPMLDHIGVFHLSDGGLQKSYATGDALPFAHRPIKHRQFLFPLVFEGNKNHMILIRVQTSGALQVPLVLWRERAFFAQDAKESLVNAMYYGILLIMAAFNLLLYFSLKEKSYFLYVFFVVSILVLMTSIYGYGFQYLYPDHPKFHGLLILLIVPVTQISMCLFTMRFLKLAESSKYWYRLFFVLIFIEILSMIGALVLPYNISTRISVGLSLPIIAASVAAGIKFWWDGDRGARWFSIAWLAFLIGAAGVVLNRLGFTPSSFFIELGIPISTSAQTMLFALALASRFNTERDARMKAQQEYLSEISKRREVETQLIYAASHHEITGLPNRLLFENAIRPHIDSPPAGRDCVAIVLLHVRRFDDVNKTLGHRNADVLLRRIGERIDNVLKEEHDPLPLEKKDGDVIYAAHIEGVSFCFALARRDRENILEDIEGLIKRMSQPMEFMGLALELSFLVGCSFVDEDEVDPQTLLRQAFIAFDTANRKLSPVAIYEPNMNPYSAKRLTLMTELRSALEYDGLDLFFQPQIHLQSKRVSGFEALLRWVHHEYGFVSPDEFIPMAEKTGLMKQLTRWVLMGALDFCEQLNKISSNANISVNVSALNLREPDFCHEVREMLKKTSVDARRLVLEVAETAAMIDPDSAMTALSTLHEADIRLSIDDFGTGRSSLSYIRKLPVHEIKIDRSLVRDMHMNKNDATIVRTTVNMCHDLGYGVVAEGVETQRVADMLKDMRCDTIQGYHVARPMNASDTLEWLAKTHWRL